MSFPSYPAYKDSGVEWLGEVPRHWPVYSLKRTVDGCVNGLWGDEPDGENDIAVIRVADFERSFATVGLDKLTYRSITAKEKQSRLIKSGDLLIEKSGGGEKTLVGCVVLFKHEFEAITSNFVARMRPLSEFDCQFLCYAFGNLYHGRVNYPSVKQVTGIQNLDAESYLQQRFCFPARVEQTQIARFLDHETARIDALIEEQQLLIELLKEKRQTVISHAVTKGLDPTAPMKDSGVEWLGEVPAHWVVRKVSVDFLASKGSRAALLTKEYCHDNYGEYPVYSGQTENGGVLGEIADFDFDLGVEGAILSTTVGAKAMSVSHIQGRISLSQNCMIIKPMNRSVSVRFFFYHFQPLFSLERRMIPDHMQPSFRMEDLYSFKVAIPPESEQKQISEHLDAAISRFDELISEGNSGIALLDERRSALISAAVTGKIDVRGWQPSASAPTQELEQEAV
ncbi:restriction endonuclease subunit S [Pseudomonas veronii]|uniref:restriction endonuclease subunit S n=1 Tax=Pseudomonas veronii TaxID=76761 RepID=UPI0015A1F68A|nr:restriction endonuclease subunit S [Pseudomonas veronii]NWD55332.1 restriction endonuclease subunit S [Pseudomonas veronii]